MREVVEILQKKGLLFKSLKPIEPKLLGTRKKIEIYEGVDLAGYYTAIFVINQKSRFLRKNAEELEALFEKLVRLREHNYKKRILLYQMPICSKAVKEMKERKWRLIDASV